MSNEQAARQAGVSYGEYLRGHGIKVAYANSANGWDASNQKRFDKTNEAYRAALGYGLNPENVTMPAIRKAYAAAENG